MPIGSEKLKEFYVHYRTTSDLRGSRRIKGELRNVSRTSKRTKTDFVGLRKEAAKLGRGFLVLTTAAGGTALALGRLASRADVYRQQMEGLVGLAPKTAMAFSKAATDIAATYGKTLEEVGAAFYSTTSAGYRGQQAENIVLGSAQASAAGLGTVAEVAKLLTLSLSVFKDDGLEAAEALDKLAAGARQANFDGNALGAILPSLGLSSKQLSIDFGELTGLSAALSKQMANAGEAGTALESLLQTLIAPAEMGRKTLDKMGLSVQDLYNKIADEGLLAGLALLEQTMRDNTDTTAEYGAVLDKIITRKESKRAYAALIGDMEQARSIVAEVSGATGTLDEALKPVRQGTNELYRNLKIIGAELGEGFLPMIDRTSRSLGNMAQWLNKSGEGVKQLLTAFVSGRALLGWGITPENLATPTNQPTGSGVTPHGRTASNTPKPTNPNPRAYTFEWDQTSGAWRLKDKSVPAQVAADPVAAGRRVARPRVRPIPVLGEQRFGVGSLAPGDLHGREFDFRFKTWRLEREAAEEIAAASRRAADGLLNMGDQVAFFLNKVGLGGPASALRGAIGGIDAVRGGIGAFKDAKAHISKAGGIGSLLASNGPMIAVAGAATAIFGFLKIRAARREKREQRRRQEQVRMHYETLRALNPYSNMRGQSLGNIGRYWHGGGFENVFVGNTSGPPSAAPAFAPAGRASAQIQAPVNITVNPSPGMNEQDLARMVSRELGMVFRQTASDFG